MNEHHQPVTTASAVTSNSGAARAPRTFGSDIMRELIDTHDAVVLGDQPRLRLFVRYDDTWWIDGGSTFIEVLDNTQIIKLARWHQRLTEGSLWA
jgi:hypothetical protein